MIVVLACTPRLRLIDRLASPNPASLQEVTVDKKMSMECIMMDEAALQTYDNMIKLNDLNEPIILHNLRQRFLKDQIYTYVSSILVSCTRWMSASWC